VVPCKRRITPSREVPVQFSPVENHVDTMDVLEFHELHVELGSPVFTSFSRVARVT